MTPPSVRLSAPARRKQLLDVAIDVFSDRGYHSASMNDLASAAGVTKPVLYQHFESKHALYLALIDEVGNRLLTAIISSTVGFESGREKTINGFIGYFNWVSEHPHEFKLLFGSTDRTDADFLAAVRELESNVANAIAPLINAAIDPAHQHTLALGLVGLAMGVSQHLVAEDIKIDAVAIGTQVAQLAWAGLRSVGKNPYQD